VSAYHLSFDRTFKRQVNSLPGKLRQEAKRRIADLTRQPYPAGAIELRGYPNVCRMWLSDARYRLVWEVFEDEHRVAIYYVGLKPDYDELLRQEVREESDERNNT
jgi:mRNA-degrading endonuclease RelE of RelBE toxin-antitoxin system